MRISRVYTRTGDDGSTGLVGGRRVGKDSPRVVSYGEVDELNAILGLCRAALTDTEIDTCLRDIQNHLFILGSDLASEPEVEVPRIQDTDVAGVESRIDGFLEELAPLKEFILPAGTEAAARLHLARTACRRAERHVVALSRSEPINPRAVVYLNRLSDLLFVLARLANHRAGEPERYVDFGKKA